MRCHLLPMPPCVCDFDLQEINRGQLQGLPKKELKDFARKIGILFEAFGRRSFGQEVYTIDTIINFSQMHQSENASIDFGNTASCLFVPQMQPFLSFLTARLFQVSSNTSNAKITSSMIV